MDKTDLYQIDLYFGRPLCIMDIIPFLDTHKRWRHAIMHRDIHTIKTMLDNDEIDVDFPVNADGQSGLFSLSGGNIHHRNQEVDLLIIGVLIQAKADVNIRGSGGWTPLMAAVWNNNIDKVKLLVDARASPNICTIARLCPLEFATRDIAYILLREGAMWRNDEFDSHLQGIAMKVRKEHLHVLRESLPLPVDGGHILLHKGTEEWLWNLQ